MKYIKAFGFAFLILGLFAFSDIVGALIIGAIYGLRFEMFLTSPGRIIEVIIDNILVISIIGSFVAMLFFWVVFLFRKDSLASYSQLKKVPPSYMGLALLAGLGLFFVLSGLIYFSGIEKHFPEHEALLQALIFGQGFWLPLLGIGILAPVVEEFAFRGLIFNRLSKDISVKTALLLQAVFFGAIHFNVLQSSYAFIGGLLLGLVYVWTGSLYIPIFMHMGWNCTAVVMAQITAAGLSSSLLMLILFISGCVLLPIMIKALKNNNRPGNNGEQIGGAGF